MLKNVFISFLLLAVLLISAKDVFAQNKNCALCEERTLKIKLAYKIELSLKETQRDAEFLNYHLKQFHKRISTLAGLSFDSRGNGLGLDHEDGEYEYTISGLVTGKPEKYTFSLTFVASYSKEVLASGSIQFAGTDVEFDAIWTVFNNLVAGGNLYDIAYAYEKKRRDAEVKYAIRPKIILHMPETSLKLGDAMPFEVELVDCDKQPLKGRIITFEKPSLGTLDKYEVTTDDNGKAILTYTAPKRSGRPGIIAKYDFTYASGRQYGDAKAGVDLVIGDPDAPPIVPLACNAGNEKMLKKAEKWAIGQWPAYLLSKKAHAIALDHWKTWKKAGLSDNVGQIKLERDEAIKIADKIIVKIKDIFHKYKSVPEYSPALNYLLKFSYDTYKDALEKEPQWDINKDAAAYNIHFADLYLKKVKIDHNYSMVNNVAYFLREARIFKDDRMAEYSEKVQNALKFKINITGSQTRNAPDFVSTVDFSYDKAIDGGGHSSIEDQMTLHSTHNDTDPNGRHGAGSVQVPVQFAWRLNICADDQKDDFELVPLVTPKAGLSRISCVRHMISTQRRSYAKEKERRQQSGTRFV